MEMSTNITGSSHVFLFNSYDEMISIGNMFESCQITFVCVFDTFLASTRDRTKNKRKNIKLMVTFLVLEGT